MSKRLVELIILGALLVLAVLLYGSTAAYPQAVQGSTAAYVRFLALALGLLCLFETISSLIRYKKHKNHAQQSSSDTEALFSIGKNPQKFWVLFVLLLFYAGIFSYLGFYIASALFLPITMYALGARKPLSISLTTLGVLGFVYVVFERILEVYMPIGTYFE